MDRRTFFRQAVVGAASALVAAEEVRDFMEWQGRRLFALGGMPDRVGGIRMDPPKRFPSPATERELAVMLGRSYSHFRVDWVGETVFGDLREGDFLLPTTLQWAEPGLSVKAAPAWRADI